MSELFIIRHAQASFGAADYDVLSPLGHQQSVALGRALAQQGVEPDALFAGAQRRHRETLAGILQGMGANPTQAQILPGLNEFDFKGLLDADHADGPLTAADASMHTDRKTHFRILRDTVLAWQRDEIANPPETWAEFSQRVAQAAEILQQSDAKQILAVSSGGAIGQMIATTLQTPPEQQIRLQLQMKNCAVNRFVSTGKALYLHGYNETPHINAQNAAQLLTYS